MADYRHQPTEEIHYFALPETAVSGGYSSSVSYGYGPGGAGYVNVKEVQVQGQPKAAQPAAAASAKGNGGGWTRNGGFGLNWITLLVWLVIIIIIIWLIILIVSGFNTQSQATQQQSDKKLAEVLKNQNQLLQQQGNNGGNKAAAPQPQPPTQSQSLPQQQPQVQPQVQVQPLQQQVSQPQPVVTPPLPPTTAMEAETPLDLADDGSDKRRQQFDPQPPSRWAPAISGQGPSMPLRRTKKTTITATASASTSNDGKTGCDTRFGRSKCGVAGGSVAGSSAPRQRLPQHPPSLSVLSKPTIVKRSKLKPAIAGGAAAASSTGGSFRLKKAVRFR